MNVKKSRERKKKKISKKEKKLALLLFGDATLGSPDGSDNEASLGSHEDVGSVDESDIKEMISTSTKRHRSIEV